MCYWTIIVTWLLYPTELKEQLDEQNKNQRDQKERCDKAERLVKVLEVDLQQSQQQVDKLEESRRGDTRKVRYHG